MRSARIRALLFATAVAAAIGFALVPRGADAIIGGQQATIGDYPFAVYLTTAQGVQFCGGALVAPDKVITAAHCVAGQKVNAVRVVLGREDKQSATGTEAKALRIWVHPQFTTVLRGSDVAVITLVRRFGYRTVPLATPADAELYRPGTPAVILGWGRTTPTGAASRDLRAATVPVVADAACAATYQPFQAATMVCAGYPQGGVDACQGDSGGPMVAGGHLVGLVSWGQGCALAGRPGVYTRVSAFSDVLRAAIQGT